VELERPLRLQVVATPQQTTSLRIRNAQGTGDEDNI